MALGLIYNFFTAVMGWTKGVTEVQEVFWADVPDGERSDTGGPILPNDFQYRSGRSGKGGPDGNLLTSVSTP